MAAAERQHELVGPVREHALPAIDDHTVAVPEVVEDPVYVVVSDVDAHATRARAAGAEILRGPEDTDHGSREYAARDPEGHVWSFGTYDPWAA